MSATELPQQKQKKKKPKFVQEDSPEPVAPSGYQPPNGFKLLGNDPEGGNFDWEAVSNDPNLEIWAIRVPLQLKPKYLDKMSFPLAKNGTTSGPIARISAGKKQTQYDITVASGSTGAEEMKGMACLLPRKSKGGKLYLAQKPLAGHLLFSESSASPIATSASPTALPLPSSKRLSHPQYLLKHKYIPTSARRPTAEVEDPDITMDDVEQTIVPHDSESPVKPHKKRKKGDEELEASMFFDLNIPIVPPATLKYHTNASKKKGKQKAEVVEQPAMELFSSVQVEAIEKRIDVLNAVGYTVLALNQTIQSSFSANGHVNFLDELVKRLKKREGVIILKRLTIVLDDASEKGTGLAKQHQSALSSYDILSLQPTSQATFSLACLKHSVPSPLTAHIISLPLTGPRLPFFFKHSLVRNAAKNGAVMEICYSPAVGGAGDVERRNWWAACRELTRLTAGKGVIISSGNTTTPMVDVRAPKDVMNIAMMLGFSQDEANRAMSETARKMTIRALPQVGIDRLAGTRKTYQAVLSEPTITYPEEDTYDDDWGGGGLRRIYKLDAGPRRKKEMSQWNQVPQGFQYPMQTGIPFQQQQQQQQLVSQPTGYPSLQQPPQQRPPFATLQPQATGYPGASSFQPQATGFNQFQRPMLTGAPTMGFQNTQPGGGIPPVPALPSNLNVNPNQNRFLTTSPSPSGFSPGPSGPPSGFQPTAAPLVAQPTGFMDPRLTMMGSTFMPSAGGNFPMGGAAQYNGATLQQSIAQHNQDKRGSTEQRIPWALSKQERKQYDQIFRAWDATGSGFLDGQKALEVFGASGLDKNDLVKIWSLADPDDRGKLNREEFHVAMGLIYRRLNGNDIPEQLPPELVPPSANSLAESVDMLRDLLKNDNYGRNTAESPQTRGKVRTFDRSNGMQDARKDGANYKHDDEEEVPVYRSSSRYVDRKAVRAGTESPSADLAEMQRQLENAAKRIDKVTAEQAARSQEDEDLEQEMEEVRRRVKRVQDDLEYVSRGPRSFEKDEDRRKLERELLSLLHERLPELQRKMDDRDRRKRMEKDSWVSDRDRRNNTFGRYGQLDRDRDRDRDRSDYRRYDDRREEDRGYMKGTYDRSRDGSRERNRDDRYGSDRYDSGRDSGRDNRDRYGRGGGYDRPRSPPQNGHARTPPPAPAPPAVEKARPPPPAPSPTVATKNMTPEERQAFIRAEAARRLEERQQRLGLIAPSVTPTPDNSVEERLARERAEAAEKASAAEKEAEQREAARKARLASDRGDAPTPTPPAAPAPPAPVAVPSPVTPSSPPSVAGRKKAPPPPAPRPRGAPLPSAMKKVAPAAPPAPRPVAVAPPPPPVAAPAPPPAREPEPEVDPEEEAFRARQAKLQKAREEREARMRELERMEEEARLEEQRFQERRAAYASRSATSTPVPTSVPAPPAPPPPPVPTVPATAAAASTNPFHRMQQGGSASAASPAANTGSGFNPFARPAVSSVPPAPPAPPVAPVSKVASPPPPPPAPPAPVQEQPVAQPSPPVVRSPVPAPAPPAPVSRPAAAKRPSYDDEESWDSPHEKDDDDDSSDDDRTARQKLAAHLFGTVVPSSPRPESRASNTKSPAPVTPAVAPPPPPPAPPAQEVYAAPIPAAPGPPPPPPPMAAPPMAAPIPTPAAGGDGRGALLQSILGGARLKPTKTVDRSGVQGAGAVLGDAAPPEHIIQPPRSDPDPVDWYEDAAAPPAPPPPPPGPSSVAEETYQSYSAVPAINIQSEEAVPAEPDPLEDVDMQTSQRVRSLYPYEGQRDEDLSFSENTVIVAHPSKSGGPWWYGILPLTGKKGFFPHTYVQDLEEVQAVALYAYQGTNPDEFSFQEGDKITIVDRSEEDWWKTEQGNQILIVPAAYLQLVSATLPSSASVHSTESKISSLLHFLGGRTRTPGEGSSAPTERKVISGPISLPSPSRENSPAFGSSWSSLVDKEVIKEMPPHERKRQEAIFELINTESAYVRDLQLIVGVFYASTISLLDEKAIKVVFANVEDLLLTNTAFLSQLEERQKECRLYIDNIGDLLEKHIGDMGVYMQYCVNQSNAIKILQALRDNSSELAAKLHQLREHDPSVRNLDLSSYLLSPMQRITRYPLLIRQILQYTQHGHDRELIQKALLAAESILEAINESIRDQEGNDRLKELSKTLWVGNGQLDLTAPTRFMGPRRLIKEGIVTKAKSRRRIRVVLCSDIVVLVEEATGAVYRIPIPLSSANVYEAQGARDDLGFAISTSYPRGGTQIGLRASSPRECQVWIKEIQEAQLKCVDAERRHLRRQSHAMRTSMG
ncbi:hypothetical protein M408DRAFT_8613 [Serendipita vermifera MAFF 305830]|uniref:Actin cytoskeleton-regulatory complex protein PAN1 n=1 Tax=Serendipita vermifera MAFF 305830 TaxID=933852 RepID=A0A0C2WRQ0_SERVB|nr:hypothetical protein M408DRAFT_8613 [Serendipita vermifera MAFF 305830]